ncbi:putative MAPEG superfamily protein [Herbaspirillum sp. Sphag1AN]|uniref:MAPEG family protein n=1 Tax=unclassified Herbaspirillum TaxID=2624150 RepID=UPI00160A7576|nr:MULTISPECIES: MAPEG family protein [unclassified Herbaspirillum]MBB3214349.1 putative MAPEG superfamily protein [Herbaspirillum sp. Sphag1AN]MBB3247401.1 putative MAPEG superfamily protein [Herbaspirillum sp. Sphag64]
MAIAYWCILVAGLLPIITVAVAKWGKRDFDNHEPRAWMERLTGLRRRADYAHRNHFEAFPFFAAAVLVAQQTGVAQTRIDTLALTFIIVRLIYTMLYLRDLSSLRSLAWIIGYGCVIALFVSAALYGHG